MKESSILKKALAGDGDWAMVKEILGWVIDTNWGTLDLSSKQGLEILSLLAIPTNQRRILVKKIERLVGKLRSMPLAVLGGISHFYAT